MKLSTAGVNWLKAIEHLHLKPYDDQTGKLISSWVPGATIGYGHLISQAEWPKYKNGVTLVQAEALFREDLAPFEETVARVVAKAARPQTESQVDALVILAFNIGKTAFAGSTVAKMIQNPKGTYAYKTLEKAWKAWNKSQGKVNQGVINRRNAEWDMYNTGVYRFW